jgi:hypothetical protein
MTIEKLIEKHPKIFQPYEGNPYMVNWTGLPNGWIPVIDTLCSSIQNYIDNHVRYVESKEMRVPQVTCTQMKEKFAGLRFYYNGGDDIVEGMVTMAEYMCRHTCEHCSGSTDGKPVNINGWMRTLCQTCKENVEKRFHES